MSRHYTVIGNVTTYSVFEVDEDQPQLLEHDDTEMEISRIYDDSGREYTEDDPIWEELEVALYGSLY